MAKRRGTLPHGWTPNRSARMLAAAPRRASTVWGRRRPTVSPEVQAVRAGERGRVAWPMDDERRVQVYLAQTGRRNLTARQARRDRKRKRRDYGDE